MFTVTSQKRISRKKDWVVLLSMDSSRADFFIGTPAFVFTFVYISIQTNYLVEESFRTDFSKQFSIKFLKTFYKL